MDQDHACGVVFHLLEPYYYAPCLSFIPGNISIISGTSFDFQKPFAVEISLPYPLKYDSFPRNTLKEPVLVDFPKALITSKIANACLAVMGFVLASVILFRLRKTSLFRRDGSIKSLLGKHRDRHY